jgi:hypothetical protein
LVAARVRVMRVGAVAGVCVAARDGGRLRVGGAGGMVKREKCWTGS